MADEGKRRGQAADDPPLRAAIYGRLSYHLNTGTPDDGLPLERQVEDSEELVDRNGWELFGVYLDDKISAWTGKDRPAWQELLVACIEGKVDAVVAWNDDRLWRNVVEQAHVFEMLAEHDVQLIAFPSGRSYNPADVSDQFTGTIHAAVSQHESAVKSVRTIRAMRQRAVAGRWLGGKAPYGYRRPTETEPTSGAVQLGGLVVVEDEAKVVQEMARRTLAGESGASIARDLEQRGVPAATGDRWTYTRMRDILTNPLYAGQKRYLGVVVADGRWDAILPRATFEAIVAHFESQARGPGAAPTRLLTGVLRCGRCGATMNGTTRKGKAYYHCKSTGRNTHCGRMTILGDPVDEWVTDRIQAALADTQGLAARLSAATEVDLQEVTDQLSAWEKSLDELISDFYVNKSVPKRAYLQARERLETNIETARTTIRDAAVGSHPDVPIGDFKAIVEWWERSANGQRRTLIATVARQVDVLPWEPHMGRKFSPERLRIVWRS